MATSETRVGPWGGKAGDDAWQTPVLSSDAAIRLSSISLSTGVCVDSLTFSYVNKNGSQEIVKKIGGNGGTPQLISFGDDEHIIGFSGTVGPHVGITVITSLSFETNKNVYGPFGTVGNNSFSLPLTKGNFAGFFGRNGVFVDSIGAILLP